MEIHPSARRHGVDDDEILHAIAGTADEIIIHAMPMRPKYRKLLEP